MSQDETPEPILRPTHWHTPDSPSLASTLGELRALVIAADSADIPDDSDVYVTIRNAGATRHGSPLRQIVIVAPRDSS